MKFCITFAVTTFTFRPVIIPTTFTFNMYFVQQMPVSVVLDTFQFLPYFYYFNKFVILNQALNIPADVIKHKNYSL